jgi:hypothetical protein
LDFFNARYFGAAIGRFTSVDPENAGADLYNPQTWNGYGYVNNNPLNATDPSGNIAVKSPTFNGTPEDAYQLGWISGLFGPVYSFTGMYGGDAPPSHGSGVGGGGTGGGQGQSQQIKNQTAPPKNDVNKTWSRTFPCASGATHVMAAMQNDMGAFANNQSSIFTARFPDLPIKMGGTYSIFPGLNNGTGGMLPSGPLPTGSLNVRVTKVSSSGWTFTTNPSQHYIDGTVSFSAVNAGSGNITFSIHAQGNFAGPISWALQPIIKAGENSNWNNMLNNVQGFCQLGW